MLDGKSVLLLLTLAGGIFVDPLVLANTDEPINNPVDSQAEAFPLLQAETTPGPMEALKKTPALSLPQKSPSSSTLPVVTELKQPSNTTPSSNTEVLELLNRRRNAGFESMSQSDTPMSQITNVNQLRDVEPTEWAYEALRSLVERYGCIVGYPDSTYRGDRALTRWEFAAGLNACLNTIERLLQENVAVLREDLDKLKRLAQEFQQELAALGTRLDNLEYRTAFLEDHQFSTTVSFGGEVIIGLADAWGGNPPGTGTANTVLNYLARVGTVASFTGTDRLRVILASGNFPELGFANPNSLNTYAALLSYQDDLNNQVIVDSLDYRFAAFDNRVVFTLQPVGFSLSSVLSANSAYYDVGRGALSRFGLANPIYQIGALDGGVGFDWLIFDRPRLQLQVAYGTRNSQDPSQGFIGGADHSALGTQLLFIPTDTIAAGLTYINAYNSDGRLDTFTGSFNADTSSLILEPAQTNAVAASFQWRFVPNLTFGAWGGYTFTNATGSDSYATTSTYLLSLGWTNAFQQGDLIAFLFGQPPTLENGNNLFLGEDNATAYHYELFYRYNISERISITPGLFVVTHPGSRAQNSTIFVGAIRTTFRF